MKERKILTDSIADHKRAIEKAERELEKLEVTYSIGDRFIITVGKFILVQCEARMVALVALHNGNRFNSPTKVTNVNNITPEEFGRMCYYNPTRYWDARKGERI